jgi:hypothetical protein
MDIPLKTLNATDYKIVKVYGMDFRPDIKDMADTVTSLGLWQWFHDYNPPDDKGYSWDPSEDSKQKIDQISNGLQCNNHSGATFACCLRIIQSIAKQGFTTWNLPYCPE